MSCVFRSGICAAGYSVYKDCDCYCVTARTLLREVAFWQRTMALFLVSSSLFNSTNVECWKERPELYTEPLKFIFFTNFAAQKCKARMETIEGFVNLVYFINFWTREQAQSKVCKHAEWTTNVINGHYKLASPSTKQMVSNKCHKREREVNQSRADHMKSVRSEVESGRKLP